MASLSFTIFIRVYSLVLAPMGFQWTVQRDSPSPFKFVEIKLQIPSPLQLTAAEISPLQLLLSTGLLGVSSSGLQ